MTSYPALQLPEAWKPLLKALADEGWELVAAVETGLAADCRLVLVLGRDGLCCCLSFWEEVEWCGNNLQRHGLTLAGLSVGVPAGRSAVEPHVLLLTGNWVEEVDEFIAAFFRIDWVKSGLVH
jgi:hypothetical protein